MKEKYLLIGSKGELGRKISSEIDIDKEIDIENKNELEEYCNDNNNIIALIVTPPSTHLYYIKLLINKKSIKQILCEKPLPDYKELDCYTDEILSKIRIIDHYLYKKHINEILKYYNHNKNKINRIELFLCEEKKEFRTWMFDKKYGGVTYDLAHHLIAILGFIDDFDNLCYVRNLNIIYMKKFGENLSDKELKCSFEMLNAKIFLHVGKSIKNNKKIIFYTDKEKKEFNLNESVNYKDIIKNKFKLLKVKDAIRINSLLKNILEYQNVSEIIYKYKFENTQIAISIIEKLNEEFKHRHQFYWSIYYKLLFYYLFLVISPGLLFYYTKEAKLINGDIILYVSLILSIIILIINIFILKRNSKYLQEEEHRLKIVLNNLRNIYYANFGINLYPNKKQKLSYKEILLEEIIKNKNKNGLGTTYMLDIFNFIVIFTNILLIIFFLIYIFLNNKTFIFI